MNNHFPNQTLAHNVIIPSQRIHQGKPQAYTYGPNGDIKEGFANWDDPFKNLRPTIILDFLRTFALTR